MVLPLTEQQREHLRGLREAQLAVEASSKSVSIETEISRGPVGPVLVEASRDAEIIALGRKHFRLDQPLSQH